MTRIRRHTRRLPSIYSSATRILAGRFQETRSLSLSISPNLKSLEILNPQFRPERFRTQRVPLQCPLATHCHKPMATLSSSRNVAKNIPSFPDSGSRPKGSARLTGKKVARQKLRETAESSRRCDDKILAGSQLTGTAVPVTHTHRPTHRDCL